ncbi:MAG: OmpA family protein [Chitinispirillaceae bacterium]|nr:OmpA family protein [Chitinispirillaceae bacterium]
MSIKKHFIPVTVSVAAGIVIILAGCSKKTVQVSPLPEPVTVKEAVSVVAPAVSASIDSAAILEALMREVSQNIYFDFNKSNLRADAIGQLTAIGRVLMDHQSFSITIDGHCDERGTSEYNMGLGENRAIAAKNWLVAYGIADSKIQTNSYGKERHAVEGCTEEYCYQKNRRGEFKMVSYRVASY